MGLSFREKCAQAARHSLLCVGFDPLLDKIPRVVTGGSDLERIRSFNERIAVASMPSAGFAKPNIAFYEEHGPGGLDVYKETMATLRDYYPNAVRIGDWKRGDVMDTATRYVKAAAHYGVDALTANPYIGAVPPAGAKSFGLQPFLADPALGVFWLCVTSNPEAEEFECVEVYKEEVELASLVEKLGHANVSQVADRLKWRRMGGGWLIKMYHFIAMRVAALWNGNENCGLVVGGTQPEKLGEIRFLVGDAIWFLVPGFGKQGGDLQKALGQGLNKQGSGLIINFSSGISYAWKESKDPLAEEQFEALATGAADTNNAEINAFRVQHTAKAA